MEESHEQILNGFQLNSDTLWEMRQLLQRRPQTKFSDGLSDEAKLVIHQLKEESKSYSSDVRGTEVNFEIDNDIRSKPHKTKTKLTDRRKSRVSYVDSIRKSSLKLDRDITDPNFTETNLRKRALGGGHVESALETIEVINADNPEENTEDDFAIEETAKHNSVEKCIVWMEVNENEDDLESHSGAAAE